MSLINLHVAQSGAVFSINSVPLETHLGADTNKKALQIFPQEKGEERSELIF